jgi:hypothetical protein
MNQKELSPLPFEKGGITYAGTNEKFGEAVIKILRESSSRAPMRAAIRLSAGVLPRLIARFIPAYTTNGLSVVAMPIDHSGTLACAFICRDFKSAPPEGLSKDFPWFNPIAEALMKVDGAYEANRPGLVLREAVDFWMAESSSFSPVRTSRTTEVSSAG